MPGTVDVMVVTSTGTATVSSLFTFLGQEIAVDSPGGNGPGLNPRLWILGRS